MKSQPLISICIPTYKREYLIEELINGIYSQKCDNSLFEVCITDNSDTDETENLINDKFSEIENLHYEKVECEGFRNSVEALKLGKGQFLKLHNDYSMFYEGSIQKLIEFVKDNLSTKPVVFYTLRGNDRIEKFCNFNSFINASNYLTTWSTSFSIWKVDFDRIMDSVLECNYMYPHTSLLFAEGYKTSFIIDNYNYFYNVQPKNKGGYKGKKGYNLLDNFVRIFLTMVDDDLISKQLITSETRKKIESNILRFCAKNYINLNNRSGYTYKFDNSKKIITTKCGMIGYIKYLFYCIIYRIRRVFKPNDIS